MTIAALLLASIVPAQSRTGDPTGLDSCVVIVTGTDSRTRGDGVATCLRRVLAKVSGRPGLAADGRIAGLAPNPEEAVEDIVYFDRMGDIPYHDEQGSRDRPHDLVVHFAPARIDALLTALGAAPWRDTRPVLVIDVTVRDRRGGVFALNADGGNGEQQREALAAAADRFGMRAILPISVEGQTRADAIAAARRRLGALPSATVSGILSWEESAFGWTARWTLTAAGRADSDWSITGVSFDEAFRDAIGGAAERLAPRL